MQVGWLDLFIVRMLQILFLFYDVFEFYRKLILFDEEIAILVNVYKNSPEWLENSPIFLSTCNSPFLWAFWYFSDVAVQLLSLL